MKKNTRFAKSLTAMFLILITLLSLCVSAFAAGDDIYFPRYTGSSGSIVTALNAVGADSSYSNRCKIAAVNNISNYKGSSSQNTQMLQLLKAGKLIDPAKKSAPATENNEDIYFKKYTGSSNSIVTALNAIGADSSYSNRCKIAAVNNISNYRGSSSQNTQMLQLLKAGKLIDPAKKTSSGTPTTPAPTTPEPSNGPISVYASTVYNTSGYKMTAKANVKLRTSAKIWGSVYATLDKGTLVSTCGTVKNIYGTWYKVKIGDSVCYASYSDLTAAKTKTVATLVKATKTAYLRSAPYDTGSIVKTVPNGTILHAVGVYSNKYGNLWYVVKIQGRDDLCYIYSGNVAKAYRTSGAIYLDAAAQFQTTKYTCSAAAALTVLRYYNTALDVKDTTMYSSTDGYVFKTKNAVNAYLGTTTYKYETFSSLSAYENAIRRSLSQGSPVIARVKFSKGYFNYNSNGHYTTIIGIYTDDAGTTWLKIADSYVNRFAANSYSDPQTGIVYVPISTMYKYGIYGGTSAPYLIYNN